MNKEKFYQRLSYSFGNEDPITEQRALKIQPTDTVVCVTASGDRPLNLLVDDCKKIYSIDINPIQNHLLELKKHAMKELDFEDYLSFLGASLESYPHPFIDSVIDNLPDNAKLFWKENLKLLEDGVLYQGAMEKLCFWIALTLNSLYKKEIQNLFLSHDIFQQQNAIENLFNKKTLSLLAKFFLNSPLTKKYFADPGLYAFVDKRYKIEHHFLKLIKQALSHHFVKENALLNLVFQGKVLPTAFPPYLKKEGVMKIRSRLEKIEVINLNMIQFLQKQPDDSIDCFSFSDIASYMSEKDFNLLIKEMIRTASENARFCIRELLSNHQIADEYSKHLIRKKELEEELQAIDKCFVYRFMVGEIKKL